MHQSVIDAFSSFTGRFEGVVEHMYLDVKGLVTIARGNLIDPISMATSLPFERKSGGLASPGEIATEWRNVKARTDLALKGAGSFRSITALKLSQKSCDELVRRRLLEMEAHIKKRFPEFDSWPADAQLGIMSMSWAMGSGFNFPRFEAAVKKRDFLTAAATCKMNEAGNPGLKPRNEANVILFTNAARILEEPDTYPAMTLHWPDKLPDHPLIPVVLEEPEPEVKTQPAVDIIVPEPPPAPIPTPDVKGFLAILFNAFKFLISMLTGKKLLCTYQS